MKQWAMAERYRSYGVIRFVIGDVRDQYRLARALTGVDYVVHAAALKIVPVAEYNPFECVQTNINGAMNVINAAIDRKVKKVVALSTDKASSPINLYGGTKLVSDKLFVAGNSYSPENGCIFSVVRYGNVMGSRGSVIPLFLKNISSSCLPITDIRMTRFMISLQMAVEMVELAFQDMEGGEIYVRKIPSMKVTDIAKAISPDCEFKIIGKRPGEKLHEEMISIEEAECTYEYQDYFKIMQSTMTDSEIHMRKKLGAKVPEGFRYASDLNDNWMSRNDLIDFINLNKTKFLGL